MRWAGGKAYTSPPFNLLLGILNSFKKFSVLLCLELLYCCHDHYSHSRLYELLNPWLKGACQIADFAVGLCLWHMNKKGLV